LHPNAEAVARQAAISGSALGGSLPSRRRERASASRRIAVEVSSDGPFARLRATMTIAR
jgi:hypothetical protein